MAYDISVADPFSSRPSYDLFLYVRRNAQSGRSTNYAWQLQARWHSGSPRAWESASNGWTVIISGQEFKGSGVLDFRSTDTIALGSGTTQWFGHDSAGNLTLQVGALMSSGNFGTADIVPTNFYTDSIGSAGSVPVAPVMRAPSLITPTSMRVQFDAGAGGSPATSWGLAKALDAAFTQEYSYIASTGTTVYTDLVPDTRYYFRARGANSLGAGPWSGTVNGLTLAAVRVDDGTNWAYWVVDVDDGTKWVRQLVHYDDGTSWKKSS